MADNQKAEQSKEGKKKSGGCLIVLLAFFLTPILVLVSIYFLNEDFKLNVNSVMSNVPGFVGNFFEKFPTKEEQQAQIRMISENLIRLDNERAVDKLLVLKSEDAGIYDKVIEDMLRLNPNKTRQVLEAIRSSTISDSVLSNTVKRIEDETSQAYTDQAKVIEGMPLDSAIEEVHKIVDASINGYDQMAQIMEQMSVDAAKNILYKLDAVDRDKIFSYMSTEQKTAIKNSHNAMVDREDELIQLAKVYQSEPAENLAETLGSTATYTLDELAIVYKNLGAKKAGEVLSKVGDEQLVLDIVSRIKGNEIADKGSDNLTPDILKSLKIYKEFDDNIKELNGVYSKMPNDKVVEVIKDMMLNASPSEVYDLDNGDLITLSDEDLVIAILRSFPEKKLSEILTLLDKTLSTELTRQLALPEN